MDAIAIVIGVVVGVGIFRAPGVVATGVDSELGFLAVWAVGGVLSLVGALCYGELFAAFPSTGGEYHVLDRAFGRDLAFLFAWARLTVIGTGSIALLGFVFGDYVSVLVPIGPHGSAIYAAALVIALVGLNALGLRIGASIQNLLTALLVVGLIVMVLGGLLFAPTSTPAPTLSSATSTVGFAMVFVLLTYGGWNEAAYLSAELRGGSRRMVVTIVGGVGAVTVLYLLANLAYVRVLGLDGLRASETVGADLLGAIAGSRGADLVSVMVALAALTSMNATIITVSRTAYALGRDVHVLRGLGQWNHRAGAPVTAMVALGGFALALIVVGAASRQGFSTMVEFTAPVFWVFFLLTGLSLLVLRAKQPAVPRPFRAPLYPLTPIVFCATCAWLLYSSLAYTRFGAVVGVAILILGIVPLSVERARRRKLASQRSHE